MMSDALADVAVFLYEDDRALADEIVMAFASEGQSVHLVETRTALLEAATRDRSLLILDRMVDGHDSLGLVETLRARGNTTPVMVISSLGSVDDRIQGLKTGGDDYLVKPFVMGELLARVAALKRRASDLRETRLIVGPLAMDLIARVVTRGPRSITLLPREFTLLEFLMRRADQVVTRAMILEGVWKVRASINTNVVDVHIGNLRRKIDADGEAPLLTNKRGIGFVLASAPTRLDPF